MAVWTNESIPTAWELVNSQIYLSEARGFVSNSLENVADEGVHDAHSLGGHPSVGVHLLEYFVDINRKRLFARLLVNPFCL